MNEEQDPEINQIAAQIEQYLRDNKRAADTLEGLTRWWVIRQKIAEEELKVKRAVKQLLKHGKIKKRVLPDGTEILSSNTKQDEEYSGSAKINGQL